VKWKEMVYGKFSMRSKADGLSHLSQVALEKHEKKRTRSGDRIA